MKLKQVGLKHRAEEERFVLALARTQLDDEQIREVNEIAGRKIDWQRVFIISNLHDVSGLVYYTLKKHDLTRLVPEDFEESLRLKYYDNAVRNIAAEKAVNKLSDIIDNKVVFIKGADLFQSLYPSTGIRSMGDIDILVEKEHAEDVWYSLLQNGFTSKEGQQIQYRSEMHENLCSHLPQLHSDTFVAEVHWNIFGIGKLYPLSKIAFETAVRVRGNIYVLSNEMKLIHLCNHFRRHLMSGASLRHLCDINELMQKHEDEINWTEIEETIKNTDLEKDMVIAMTYAHMYLGTAVPEKYFDEEVAESNTFELGPILKMSTGTKGEIEVFRNKFKSISGIKNKVSYLYRIAVPPHKWVKANFGGGGSYRRYYSYLIKKFYRS